MQKTSCNSNYDEIFQHLKTGGLKIVKALKKTRGAKLSDEIREIRRELSGVVNSKYPKNPKLRHIKILANAIWNTQNQLEETKVLFHSKGLMKISIYAKRLIEECKKNIEQNRK